MAAKRKEMHYDREHYIEGNDTAKKLYESFGFVEIDRDEDEIIMEMSL